MHNRLLGTLASTTLALAFLPGVGLAQTTPTPKPTAYLNHLNLSEDGVSDPVEISALWANQVGKADHALITTSAVFADSLASGALQGKRQAPLLFVDPGKPLDAQTKATLKKLGATKLTILGGLQAIPASLETELRNLAGISNVDRIAGESRVETSVTLAKETGAKDDTVIIARADDYADALAAGALAAKTGYPILLTPHPYTPGKNAAVELHPAVEDYLKANKIKKAIVAGGPRAVTDATVAALTKLVPNTVRAAGETRRETAVELAKLWPSRGPVTVIDGYAEKNGFHNGFAAALASAKASAPIVVSNGTRPFAGYEMALFGPISAADFAGYCGTYVPPGTCKGVSDEMKSYLRSVDLNTPSSPSVSPGGAIAAQPPVVIPPVAPQPIPPNTPIPPLTPPPPINPNPQPVPPQVDPYPGNPPRLFNPDDNPMIKGIPYKLYGPSSDDRATMRLVGLEPGPTRMYHFELVKGKLQPDGRIVPEKFPRYGHKENGAGVHITPVKQPEKDQDDRWEISFVPEESKQSFWVEAEDPDGIGYAVPTLRTWEDNKPLIIGPGFEVLPSKIDNKSPLKDQFPGNKPWRVVKATEWDIVIDNCTQRRTIPLEGPRRLLQVGEDGKTTYVPDAIRTGALGVNDQVLPVSADGAETRRYLPPGTTTVVWKDTFPAKPVVRVERHSLDKHLTLHVDGVHRGATLDVRLALLPIDDPKDLSYKSNPGSFTIHRTFTDLQPVNGRVDITVDGLTSRGQYDLAVAQRVGTKRTDFDEFAWPNGPADDVAAPKLECETTTPEKEQIPVDSLRFFRSDLIYFHLGADQKNPQDGKDVSRFAGGIIDKSKITVRSPFGRIYKATNVGTICNDGNMDSDVHWNDRIGGINGCQPNVFAIELDNTMPNADGYELILDEGALTTSTSWPSIPAGTTSKRTSIPFDLELL